MKPWPSIDRSGPDRAATGEYVGRTAEEALSRAAAALGPSAELRCWKTRRGGVGGFFATEVYVAGSTPPPGAERERRRSPRTPTDGTARSRSAQSSSAPETDTSAPAAEDRAPDPLTTLAEGTTDQVSIHNGVVTPAAFNALLAEAEAALVHDPALPAGSTEAAGDTTVDGTGQATADAIPRPSSAVRAAEPDGKPERIPNLHTRLRALGVPDTYLPRGERPTLDALASAMGTLPSAPALEARAGAIVLVVGTPSLVEQTAALLAGELGLGRRDVVRCDLQGDVGDGNGNVNGNDGDGDAGRARAAKVSAAVRVAKRRANGLIALVALTTTSADAQDAAAAADVVDCLRPHTVLAAVDASVKRADVECWLHELGPVDALAVWGLDATRTPGELLGAAPIAYADGTTCTAITWTATLLARLAGDPA